jgi:hypothetical protein
MGEWSKKVGEHGEKVVKEFFELIGWSSSKDGLDMSCIKQEKHEGKTHDIDRLFPYLSPLEDGVLNNVVTSVKYTSNDYPSSPNALFKSHFFGLAKTLECFRNSEIRRSAIKNFTGVDATKDIGVLFWLSNKDQGRDILAEVANCKGLDTFAYETIYVVDNKRISFIYDSVKGVRTAFPSKSVEFFYPSTGKNNNPVTKSASGLVLPVEYINSSVLLFRVVDDRNQLKTLVISSIDNFTDSNLRRLIGLAYEISQDWNSSTLILFPDYDSLHHKNEASEAKSGFTNQSFVGSVKVASFNADFRSMANE